jgi:hypothetical protein
MAKKVSKLKNFPPKRCVCAFDSDFSYLREKQNFLKKVSKLKKFFKKKIACIAPRDEISKIL